MACTLASEWKGSPFVRELFIIIIFFVCVVVEQIFSMNVSRPSEAIVYADLHVC